MSTKNGNTLESLKNLLYYHSEYINTHRKLLGGVGWKYHIFFNLGKLIAVLKVIFLVDIGKMNEFQILKNIMIIKIQNNNLIEPNVR